MKTRFLWSILVNLIDDALAAVVMLWVLPILGIHLSPYWLILFALIMGGLSVIFFRAGSRALMKEPVAGLASMVGTRGRVVSPLTPQGMIKIRGELWQAKSEKGDIGVGEEVIAVVQHGLSLVVRRIDTTTSSKA